jgi:hypothetical protein
MPRIFAISSSAFVKFPIYLMDKKSFFEKVQIRRRREGGGEKLSKRLKHRGFTKRSLKLFII